MNETRNAKKDKNQHIQVFLRVRPMNNAEKNGKSINIIDVPSNKEVVVCDRPHDKLSKKFTFDRVFGPSSTQVDVYNAVVSPLLEQVLAGYNCTVFAYGQTGTGKTYTMEGASNDPALHWQSNTNAGMIPRFLSHLFDELRLLEAQEYTVRVSFLELYNEELFDLLSATDDVSKIRLYEDASKKGSVIIHGLEEVTVHNQREVYKILEKGSEKRKTAATLMNAHSSRSHTVFCITVHIKENTVGGDELMKTGKLNLVDLAGSENVGRSGAVDRRAREAGNINQSLLTLGRVIIALVERAPHIPYRESKLTRLLQDSLGGRTKTSIIATVSPASTYLEETLSTLDYAHRAKNITNKPEINQKLSKKALLKEYTEEIEKLRKDLLATRERNGVYLAHQNFTEMQALIEKQGKEIEEKINRIKALEEATQNKEKIFNELQSRYALHSRELDKTKHNLSNLTCALKSTHDRLTEVENEKDEQQHLVEKHIETEKTLLSQVEHLLNVADTATADSHKLHDKIIRKTEVEQTNEMVSQKFKNKISTRLKDIEKILFHHMEESKKFYLNMNSTFGALRNQHTQSINQIINSISSDVMLQYSAASNGLSSYVNAYHGNYKHWIQQEVEKAGEMTNHDQELLNTISAETAKRICEINGNILTRQLCELNENFQGRLDQISLYVRNIIDTVCRNRQEECSELLKRVTKLKENSAQLFKGENDLTQKRRTFAKMMFDLHTQFNSLNNFEEENHAVVSNGFNRINDVCGNVSDYVISNWSASEVYKNLGEIEAKLTHIKQNVATSTMQNGEVSDATSKRARVLVNDLQHSLESTSEILTQYKLSVEQNSVNIEKEIESDKCNILNAVTAANEKMNDMTMISSNMKNELKQKALDLLVKIDNAVETRDAQSANINTKVTNQIRAMQSQVNKFFSEEMQRDVPTGSTPARKQFTYPRQFTITSPHERILQRFRETQRLVETTEEDDDTLSGDDMMIKHIANSTAISDVPILSVSLTHNTSPISNVITTTQIDNIESPASIIIANETSSIYNSCNSLKSDCNEVTLTLKDPETLKPARHRSESEIGGKAKGKENDIDQFPSARKMSIQPKSKRSGCQVLGTYN